MRLPLILFAILTPVVAVAETFQRPIPQPQTAQAEISYLAAAMLLLAALIAVQWLVNRR
jgi:hypothetical protein